MITTKHEQDRRIPELIQWLNADIQIKSALFAVSRLNGNPGTLTAADSTKPQGTQTLQQLEAAGLLSMLGRQVELTSLGLSVAHFLFQHEEQEELDQVFEKIHLRHDSVFVDVGCGAGLALLKGHKFSPFLVIGVDINHQALLAAKVLLGPNAATCSLVQADIRRLPFKTEVISHICCRLAIPYVSQQDAIAELGRVLKADGVLFLQLHPWTFYVKLLWQELSTLKRFVLNSFCLINGFVFSLVGYQMAVPLRSGSYCELYQTESRMRCLLRNASIKVTWLENGKLFRILGIKTNER